jgi:hypothetical protein
MTPLIPRAKIRWTTIYTKGKDQTDRLIFPLSIYVCPSDIPLCVIGALLFNLIVYIFVSLIVPLSIYMCPSGLPPLY